MRAATPALAAESLRDEFLNYWFLPRSPQVPRYLWNKGDEEGQLRLFQFNVAVKSEELQASSYTCGSCSTWPTEWPTVRPNGLLCDLMARGTGCAPLTDLLSTWQDARRRLEETVELVRSSDAQACRDHAEIVPRSRRDHAEIAPESLSPASRSSAARPPPRCASYVSTWATSSRSAPQRPPRRWRRRANLAALGCRMGAARRAVRSSPRVRMGSRSTTRSLDHDHTVARHRVDRSGSTVTIKSAGAGRAAPSVEEGAREREAREGDVRAQRALGHRAAGGCCHVYTPLLCHVCTSATWTLSNLPRVIRRRQSTHAARRARRARAQSAPS